MSAPRPLAFAVLSSTLVFSTAVQASPVSSPPENGSRFPTGRISLALQAGASFGKQTWKVVERIRDAGYTDAGPGMCAFCPGTSLPRQVDEDAVMTAAVRYAVTRQFAVGASYGKAYLGGGTGHRLDDTGSTWLRSTWSSRIATLAAFYTPIPQIRLGGGPSVHVLTGNGVHESAEAGRTKLGWLLEAGAEIPVSRRFFVDVEGRYHAVRSEEIAYGTREAVVMTQPWSFASVNVGVGWRLW